MPRSTPYYIALITPLLVACSSTKTPTLEPPVETVTRALVNTISEFDVAVSTAEPGDTITLANGIWKDAELTFTGKGTADQPIYLMVQDKGKVTLEGRSNIRLSGEHLHVEGLVFRNGYTPTGEVISFKTSKGQNCSNCRVTECVIDDYNPPERHESNYWVGIYGKHNRFDHNYLVAKRNRGVTLAVRLKDEASRQNYHRIDHNHFGYRPTLGSNGGETLRVGTSHHSMSNSNTIVEDNYFEHCSGELEIISSKSCQNTFRNNTFYECKGTLTMRHGNETLVENNYFFGNQQANTGGIRVINQKQTVKNNYCEGLTGYRFRGALVVMNGVPNSPLNRYFQVTDSEISNNVLVDCDHVQLCAGSDEERSATPLNTSFEDNLIYHSSRDQLFTIYDDVSGINFSNNILSSGLNTPQYADAEISGFATEKINLVKTAGLRLSPDHPSVGPNTDVARADKANTGVTWYPKKDYHITFGTGRRIDVQPGENTIGAAVQASAKGDVLVLTDGAYHQSKEIAIPHTLTIESAGNGNSTVTFERSSLFSLENGGSLSLKNLSISGRECDDYAGNCVVRTSRYSMIDNYKFIARDCNFTDLDVNHSFNVIKVFKNTFADSMGLYGCTFDNITGHVLNLDKETDDIGIYNAENITVRDCTFKDIGGVAVHLYRGGRDESTFGPILDMSNTTLNNVGHNKRNKHGAAVALHGVQYADMENLSFTKSKKLDLHLVVGEPIIKIANSTFTASEGILSNDPKYTSENVIVK